MPATQNKQQLLTLTLTALKKKFPAPPEPEKRPILDEVIFAICREGVSTSEAEPAFKKLRESFVDWNEVRVSSIGEIEETLADLPGAGDRAMKISDFLQEHFERTYTFDLEELEKKGVKQAAKQLARYKDKGVDDFAVAWVTQRALGGHAIPLDPPSVRCLLRLGVIDGDIDDLETVRAGIEHHIPKAKGYEFGEQLIQLATTLCVETPLCAQCPLKAECPTGIESASKGKGSGVEKSKNKSK